jgi:hypothetical protein
MEPATDKAILLEAVLPLLSIEDRIGLLNFAVETINNRLEASHVSVSLVDVSRRQITLEVGKTPYQKSDFETLWEGWVIRQKTGSLPTDIHQDSRITGRAMSALQGLPSSIHMCAVPVGEFGVLTAVPLTLATQP